MRIFALLGIFLILAFAFTSVAGQMEGPKKDKKKDGEKKPSGGDKPQKKNDDKKGDKPN